MKKKIIHTLVYTYENHVSLEEHLICLKPRSNSFQELSNFDTIGPILLGLKKPVHIVQLESSVNEIVNITKIAAAAAQTKRNKL